MRILLLGATGNVGQQVLKIIKKLNYELVGISFYTNTKLAITIKTKYRYSPIDLQNSNVNSYDELISKSRPNLVVNAIVGLAGLIPTLSVIKQRIDIALANKEALVVAGKFIKPLVKKNHVKIYPIDSEHAAIFKIIKEHGNNFQKIYITASGGPFYQYNRKKIQHVTYEQTIKHPK
jgi:1-deoxy-D-xylulose-5-phosphate reductoisomerase